MEDGVFVLIDDIQKRANFKLPQLTEMTEMK